MLVQDSTSIGVGIDGFGFSIRTPVGERGGGGG